MATSLMRFAPRVAACARLPYSVCGIASRTDGNGLRSALPASARRFSEESGGQRRDGATGSSSDGKSESDKQYEKTGEYDTNDAYKRVGNPISWANPTGGGTIEDTSSNAWRWIYPAGIVGIILLALWSRRKNLRKEQEEQMISSPSISPPDLRQFETRRFAPPPSSETSPSAGGDDEDYDMGKGPQFSGLSGGGFSSPPSSSQQSNW
mmetsp:Transcript_14984/g.24486  ORF Transcript_14984/g.24486 Transcript_14984/m.24486 type:complete len:208 (-) Transcript_14984:111-734(-)|eukprot:CAMPEP_0169085010 /NCGR_PEP_ID=MMETSP1015-20121227/12928_1 /TAXON_ID=342587 /ORGANISM="Karlodinium micrum, Strain CCMP2283" /LENGTH=207 /DNA_ID=CAMNT_0009145061 /DNA_START=54 /DNA_END=677 /DNA_ORIENTATION=-